LQLNLRSLLSSGKCAIAGKINPFTGATVNQEAFQHRSGRVISLARLSLALVFLVAVWADPSQPSRYPTAAYVVLAAYVAISAAYLIATWSDWWLEHRLALLAHCFDIALFGVMVYLTEGYTSPFFTFFVFIILSATVRWSWQGTAASAAAIILLFFVAGLAALRVDEANFEVTRFLIRGTYLIVLSLLLIWFGMNQRGRFLRQLPAELTRGDLTTAQSSKAPAIRHEIEQAAARTGAKSAMLVWWEREEPWLNVTRLVRGTFSEERLPPTDFGELVDSRLAGCAFIFNSKRGRALVSRARTVERLTGIARPLDRRLQARVDSDTGLVLPIAAETHGGLLVLGGIPGMCADDLEIAERFGDEFAVVLQQTSIQNVSEQAAANRTRLSLARDLHDTVAQLLAGTSMRLEGLGQAIRSGRPVNEELDTLQQELRTEQRGLRKLIGQLRDGTPRDEAVSLKTSISETLDRLSRQWGIACELDGCPDVSGPGAELEHHVSLLMREAIANAVRHGGASRVSVSLELAQSQLSLSIHDNGCGFPLSRTEGAGSQPPPWSLNERVHELGGTLMLASTSEGSELTMALPWRGET
jgi:signal transduction histidine kinase